MAEGKQVPLEKLDEYRWLLPKSYDPRMRVDGLIYSTEEMLKHVRMDKTPQQVANVATLPGIIDYSLAMPDIHWGYGFPIGGVAAMGLDDGVVSPGGVGYDINCGVRMLRTELTYNDVKPHLKELAYGLFSEIPCGIGTKGKVRLSDKELNKVLVKGSGWAVENGYGVSDDLDRTESRGAIPGADPKALSKRALERGRPQLGTLGAGNHFMEIARVKEIYDHEAAGRFGLFGDGVVMMIHSGSRGLGYQVCDDYIKVMRSVMPKYKIEVPDTQLACAPIKSPEGEEYLAAMAAAANYAWCNRQIMMHWAREVFSNVLGKSPSRLGMDLIYDVAHNIAKFETHRVSGEDRKVLVHRKGATRSFAPGAPDLPKEYRDVGQPVIIPGDMGTASYVLTGTEQAMDETFGSTCHGAGRVLGRKAAIREAKGRSIGRELEKKGILIVAKSPKTLAEEMPEAYKDVDDVVAAVDGAGLSRKVAKTVPLAVVKG
jgi:tRNA-splicing ligase RtcB